MAPTKVGSVVDDWLEIAQNAVREGAELDVSGDYDAILTVDCALVTTTAHTGTEIIAFFSEEAAGNGVWSWLERWIGPTGTAVTLGLNDTEPVGEKSISVDNPATANMDNDAKFKFIEHATDALSEIVYQTANAGDGTPSSITIAYGLANEQTSSSALFDIDDATAEAVQSKPVYIPASASRVRVLYNNKYDPDGSAVFTRCRVANTTGL